MKHPTIKQAMDMVLDPDRIRSACDLAGSPIHRSSDWRSVGYGRERAVDLHSRTTKDQLAQEIAAQLALPTAEWIKSLDPIRVRVINQANQAPKWAPTSTPEEWTSWHLKEREIAIPSPRQRIIYSIYREVLELTCDHRLARSAVAYRPGHPDPVRTTICEVAGAVRGGAHYWAHLDIRAFFPSIPWVAIRKALRGFGATSGFTDRVMGLVQVPAAQDGHCPKGRQEGCPAGLPISGILANMVLTDLDRTLEVQYGKWVRYWRYSDNLILVAGSRERLVGAVREIARWLSQVGMQLKGYDPSRPIRDLTHSIALEPLDLLGARVLPDGTIIPTPEALEATRVWVAHQAAHLPVNGRVEGTSSFLGGKQQALWDLDDIEATLDGLQDYWQPLVGFAAAQKLRLDMVSGLGDLQGDEACLWACRVPQATRVGDGCSLVAGDLSHEAQGNEPPRGDSPGQPHPDLLSGQRESGGRTSGDQLPIPIGQPHPDPWSGQRESGGRGDPARTVHSPLRAIGTPSRYPSPQARSAGGEGCGRETDVLSPIIIPSLWGSDEEGCSTSSASIGIHRSLISDWVGNLGEDGENCPSIDPDEPENSVRIDHHEGIHAPPRVRHEVTIAWATDPTGQRHLAWWSDWCQGTEVVHQVEVALVWRILSLYVDAQGQGARQLTVRLRTAKLPKMLMQAGRSVRAVTMARALLALHEAARSGSCQLLLEGPHALPEPLQRTLWAIRRPPRDARQEAS
jgi:hypothetical protein